MLCACHGQLEHHLRDRQVARRDAGASSRPCAKRTRFACSQRPEMLLLSVQRGSCAHETSPHSVQIPVAQQNAVPRSGPRSARLDLRSEPVRRGRGEIKPRSRRASTGHPRDPSAKSGLFDAELVQLDKLGRRSARSESPSPARGSCARLVLVAADRHRAPAAAAVLRVVVEGPQAVRVGACLEPLPGAVGRRRWRRSPAAAPGPRRCPWPPGVSWGAAAAKVARSDARPAARSSRSSAVGVALAAVVGVAAPPAGPHGPRSRAPGRPRVTSRPGIDQVTRRHPVTQRLGSRSGPRRPRPAPPCSRTPGPPARAPGARFSGSESRLSQVNSFAYGGYQET